jgi:anti-sigma factor RsiW
MMKDGHIEEMLPLYIEGELSDDEKRAVDEHLSSCADCREAMDLYTSLEKALVSFKKERPSPRRTFDAISGRLPLEPAFSPLSLIRSPVVLGTAAVTLIAIVTIIFHQQMGSALSGLGGLSFDSIARSFEGIPQWLVEISGGNAWLLVLIVAAETLLFSFAMGFAALKITRR